MTRRFTSEIINEIGPERDIPAPDVGTDASVMAWIFDTYSMNKGHSVLGVVTGKPVMIGGSLGREEATARGALYCIRQAVQRQSKPLEGMTMVVQGFGNVGSTSAAFSPRTARRWSPSATRAAASTTRTASTFPRRGRAQAGNRRARRAARRRGDHERGALPPGRRHPRALRARAGHQQRERRQGARQHHLRRGERSRHAGCRRDPRGQGIQILPDVLANAGGVGRLLLRVGPGLSRSTSGRKPR